MFKRYLHRSLFKNYLNNKRKIKKLFKMRFDFLKKFYLKEVYINSFPKIQFKKKAKEFVPYLMYNAYQSRLKIIKRKFINNKYHRMVTSMRGKNYLNFKKRNSLITKAFTISNNFIFDFLYSYNSIVTNVYIDVFFKMSKLNKKKKQLMHFLILSFLNNKIFVNLLSSKKKNYLFLSSGLFIKFFEKKKSFKKNKIIKILIAKYLRKIFIMSRIRNIMLISKNNPILLPEILTFINSPIVHKFQDPLTGEVIEEKKQHLPTLKFLNFIFLENLDFSKNKTKKKGRIKRKILRKVISSNKIVD